MDYCLFGAGTVIDETTSHPSKQPDDGCQAVGYGAQMQYYLYFAWRRCVSVLKTNDIDGYCLKVTVTLNPRPSLAVPICNAAL